MYDFWSTFFYIVKISFYHMTAMYLAFSCMIFEAHFLLLTCSWSHFSKFFNLFNRVKHRRVLVCFPQRPFCPRTFCRVIGTGIKVFCHKNVLSFHTKYWYLLGYEFSKEWIWNLWTELKNCILGFRIATLTVWTKKYFLS